MTLRNGLLCAGAWLSAGLCSARYASARSGLAAYHQNTDAFVTAARYEPRGALLNVVNPRNGRSILVRVNDRGPYNGNRVLDLSTGAFRALFGGLGRGTGPISYQVVSAGSASGGFSRGNVLSSRSGNRNTKRKRARRHHKRMYRRSR